MVNPKRNIHFYTLVSIIFVLALILPFNYSGHPIFQITTTSANEAIVEAVEITSMRTQTAKHFRNADGTYTAQISTNPIHFKDPTGQWQEIDSSLLIDSSGSSYRNASNSFTASFNKDADATELFKVQDGQLSIDLYINEQKNVVPSIDDKSITYDGIIQGSDIKFTSISTGVKSEIVLKNSQNNAFRFLISAVGLAPRLSESGEIVFYDSANQPKWRMPKPFAFDANKVRTNDVNYALVQIGEEYELTINVAEEWLKNPARVFPVIIDPTLVLNTTGDTFIDYLNPYTNYEYYQYLDTGSYKRALIKFDISSIPARNDIIISYLNLFVWFNGFAASHAYPITTDWVSSQATWYQPYGGGYWEGGNYDASMGASLFGESYVYANVTDAIKKWYWGDSTYYGFLVKRDEDNGGPGYFSSEYYPYGPTLTVIYSPWNGIQDRWQYVSFPQGDGQVSMVNVANGNLVITHEDWNVNSVGINNVIKRVYNSMPEDISGVFGSKWTASYDARVKEIRLAGSVYSVSYRDPMGTWFSFLPDGAGGWIRPNGLMADLQPPSGNDSWRVKYDSGVTYKFGPFGSENQFLVSIFDRNVNTISLSWNVRLQSVTDSAGRGVGFTYNYDGWATQITDNASRTTSYTYSGQYLTSFTNQNGRTTSYPAGSLSYSIDPRGNKTNYYYDGNGRISSVVYCEGSTERNTYTFTYDDVNHKTRVTDPRNNYTDYYWNKKSGYIEKITDALGHDHTETSGVHFNVTESRERSGNLTTYHYVSNQNIKLDSISHYVPDENDIVTTYYYGDANNPYLPTVKTDNQGNQTEYTYDTAGKLTKTKFWLGGVAEESNFEYWDSSKKYQLKKFTDPKGNYTQYEYNGTYYELSKVKDPQLKETTFTYDSVSRIDTKTDAEGQTTDYDYDNLDKITEITYDDSSTVTYTYDYNGNLTQMVDATGTTGYAYDYRNRLVTKTLPDTSTITYTYDGVSNLLSKTDGGGTISYAYSALNLLSTVTEPGNNVTQYTSYDNSNNLLSMTYPNGVVVTNVWDYANRLVSTESKKNTTVLAKSVYDYEDPVSHKQTFMIYKVTDKDGNTVDYTYDKLNELTSAIKKNSQGSTLDSRSWVYNENSNRTKQIINDAATDYTYDTLNRLTSQSFSSASTGWLEGWEKRVELTIDHTKIDSSLTQLPVLIHLSSSCGTNSVDMTPVFDELDVDSKKIAVTQSDGQTQLYVEVERWDSGNQEAWLWVSKSGWSISNSTDTKIYLYYDSAHADNTTYIGDTGSTAAQSVWDSNFKAVYHMSGSSTSISDSTSNANNGTKKASTEPQEVAGKAGKAQQFDGTDDYVSLGNSGTLSPSIITIESFINRTETGRRDFIFQKEWGTPYGFEATNGNQLWLTYWVGGTQQSGGYSTTTIPAQQWYHTAVTYSDYARYYINGQADATVTSGAGNIDTTAVNTYIGITVPTTSYTFKGLIDEVRVSNTNRSAAWIKATYETCQDNLISFGTLPVTFTYDDNGNMLTRSDGLTLAYDCRDFTTSITPPGGSAISMTYTGTDQTQRVQKGTTTYKYDDRAIGATVQTSGGNSTYYTTNPAGGLVGLRQGDNRYYYIFDGLGSVVGLTDASGTLINTYSYDSYGNILSQSETIVQPYKFTGTYYDTETRLYKMGARYYDPAIGRFTQADPIALPYYVGQYVYAENNPINYYDPSGYWAIAVPFIAICVSIGPVGWGILAFVAGCAVGALLATADNSAQDRKAFPDEIEEAEEALGEPIENAKTHSGKGAGHYDVYVRPDGEMVVKPHGGKGPGEPIGYNVKH